MIFHQPMQVKRTLLGRPNLHTLRTLGSMSPVTGKNHKGEWAQEVLESPPLSTSGSFPSSQVWLWAAGATGGGLRVSESSFSAHHGGEVCPWLGWGVGQALAPPYLRLLLRVDPQLHWLQVVAGHEPLLQRRQQILVLRKRCHLLPGSHTPNHPWGFCIPAR